MKVDDSILDAIIEAARVFDEADVPQADRWILVDRDLVLLRFGDKRQRRRIRRKMKLNGGVMP